jgi:uncharacterized protein YukE
MRVGNGFMGMSIEEVRATAQSMDQAAQRINEVVSRVTAAVNSTDWQGPDADRFRDAWSSQHAPMMRSAAQDVSVSAAQVRDDIDRQIWASQEY